MPYSRNKILPPPTTQWKINDISAKMYHCPEFSHKRITDYISAYIFEAKLGWNQL